MESTHPRRLENAIHVTSPFDSRFESGVISPHFIGPADSLKTPRKITLTGQVSGEATFDGSQDITISLTATSTQTPSGGIVIPWYIYPSNASLGTDAVLNNFVTVRNAHPTIPVHVIINPSNGPGTVKDADYQALINTLKTANCTILGYVPTTYGSRAQSLVKADVAKYQSLYTGIDGIFYDEASNTDTQANINYYTALTTYAHGKNLMPVYLNAGTGIPSSFYTAPGMFDVIVVYENNVYPATGEITLPTGVSRDVRSVMVYNQPWDSVAVTNILSDAKILYISDCTANYDTLPTYINNLLTTCGGTGTPAGELTGSNLTLTTQTGTYVVGVDANGSLQVNGNDVIPPNVVKIDTVTPITTNTTITAIDPYKEYFFLVSDGVTLTLPSAVNNQARYNVKCISGTCTIVPSTPTETIDGDAQVVLTSMNSIGFRALGGVWWCF